MLLADFAAAASKHCCQTAKCAAIDKPGANQSVNQSVNQCLLRQCQHDNIKNKTHKLLETL